MALSVSLPLRKEAFTGSVVRNGFGNLLPEGEIKAAVCYRLRIPPGDDFAMLEAIGGECAGAVSISSELDFAPRPAPAGRAVAGCLAGGGAGREYCRNGAGRHVLAALGMHLATAIGLPLAAASLRMVGAKKVLLVERCDRGSAPGAPAVRLHQEDCCQALGCPSELKYAFQGGPSYHSCLHLIKDMTPLGPLAIARFIDWVLYNSLIGNADAHAKNIALLTQVDGRRQLAPYYDLVPTMAFSRQSLDRAPAMRIGDAVSIDALTKANWLALVQSIESRLPYVQQRLHQMVAGIQATLPQVVAELASQGASRDLLEHARHAITTQCRRVIEAVTG